MFLDPPGHTRIRALASCAFTPHRVEALRAHIGDIAKDLIDGVKAKGGMDVIADLAEPLAYTVTAEMLGVPVADAPQLKAWSQDFAEMLGNFQHNPERAPRVRRSVEEMTKYFGSAIREVEKHQRNGLIHSLLHAELGGDRFTQEEVIANTIVVMVGGLETTTNLIANGVLTLLRNPGELARLKANPSLIPSAVEEMLRYEPPSQHTARLAPKDMKLGGKQIGKRQAVIAVMAAGNRDPERFSDPDRFDITRKDNRHLSFGWAAHFCFGAALSRIEGQTAFELILSRLFNWTLEPGPLIWRSNLGLRGLMRLPIRFNDRQEAVGFSVERPTGEKENFAPDKGGPVAELAVNSLSEAKRSLLERYVRGTFSQPPLGPISPRPSGELAPLSLSQEQLLLREKSIPDVPPLYNECVTLRMFGPLEICTLERSLFEIIRRHDIWRTSYEIRNGEWVQVVHSEPEQKSIRVIDLQGVAGTKQDAEAQRIIGETVRQPFNLHDGPLLRAVLVKMRDGEHRLFLNAHLSILDGVSAYQILPSELLTLYEAYVRGQPSPLRVLALQYGDYAYWQRHWLHGEIMLKQLDYWRKQLAGNLSVLKWPTHQSGRTTKIFRGAIYSFVLPRAIAEATKALSQQVGVTLFTTLLTAFAVLLHRYTHQHDIIVGTLSPSGRKPHEVEKMLGYFLNPVAIRFDLTENPTFHELQKQAQRLILEAILNDDVPIELLAQELSLKPNPSRNPFFTVGVSLQPPMPQMSEDWIVTSMDVGSGGAPWDFYIAFIDRPQGMWGRIQYNPDLFEPEAILRTLQDFQSLLESATESPEKHLSELRIPSD
ncbi:MAG TPA: cytochrome P450 [Candidatus Dormibacteraeota bacterium]|nr:cytochrome P450 [Candidatus Dormibacteraeota bacterium]